MFLRPNPNRLEELLEKPKNVWTKSVKRKFTIDWHGITKTATNMIYIAEILSPGLRSVKNSSHEIAQK